MKTITYLSLAILAVGLTQNLAFARGEESSDWACPHKWESYDLVDSYVVDKNGQRLEISDVSVDDYLAMQEQIKARKGGINIKLKKNNDTLRCVYGADGDNYVDNLTRTRCETGISHKDWTTIARKEKITAATSQGSGKEVKNITVTKYVSILEKDKENNVQTLHPIATYDEKTSQDKKDGDYYECVLSVDAEDILGIYQQEKQNVGFLQSVDSLYRVVSLPGSTENYEIKDLAKIKTIEAVIPFVVE
ncbi:MAG: hypothetical protein KDD52_02210 [Bdellovibrionales bacterium]|nr:hypothetical protein [Bdellovibrionales bacterium]